MKELKNERGRKGMKELKMEAISLSLLILSLLTFTA
jgi:hypothetical protein